MGDDMGLAEIAVLTKTLYDLSDFRISLGNRIRAYGMEDIWYVDQFKDLKSMEYQYEKQLKKLLIENDFGDMLDVKGIGVRTVGSIVMFTIESERIKDDAGKFVETMFKNNLKSFRGLRSLWHYAGLHVVCANCGLTDAGCKNVRHVQVVKFAKVGEKPKIMEYIGCGNFVPTAAKLRKGKPVNWNEAFRKRLLSIGSQMFRIRGSPYRHIYDEEREKAKEKHPDWSKGRTFNHAKRLMVKQLLKDFYNAYLREEDNHEENDSQKNFVPPLRGLRG